MADNLKRKVALVTGGGSGMGEATCARFALDGAAVGVMDINLDSAMRVAETIQAAGGRAVALRADVSSRPQVNSAVEKLRGSFGPVTILVNNAATEGFCPFEEIDEQSWDRMMAVNLKSVLLTSQAVLPDMKVAGWGRIINISAYGAQLSVPNMAHYFASKGGMIALTRAQAADLGQYGITVNSVSPGFIDTPMARRAIEEARFPVEPEVIYGAYPIARLGKAEEIAAACAYFASDAAGYVTAQLLGVNGGAAV